MSIRSDFIWFDGELVPYDNAKVHVLSHTLHYGLGAFEGIRAYEQPNGKGGIWRLREHIDRLIDSMKIARLKTRYEANEDGFDEALMLDGQGNVAEGTGENVFVVKNGVVSTPPATNILPGITRDTCMEILAHEGVEVREQAFARDAFYVAEEAWMVGTAAEVTPIRELDRRVIGIGSPGPVTRMLQEVYGEAVRGKVEWLRHHITVCE